MSRVIVLSDIHIDTHYKRGVEGALEAVVNEGPELVVLAGDIVNFGSLSLKFEKAKGESVRVSDQIDQAIDLAETLAQYAKQVVFVPGNHESRWERLLKHEKADALEGCVGLRLEDQFRRQGLSQNIRWVEEGYPDESCKGLWVGNPRGARVLIRHGHQQPTRGSDGRSKARSLIARDPFINQLCGHWHTAGVEYHTDMFGRSFFAMTQGHLSNDKSFAPNANWQHGFGVLEFDGPLATATRVVPMPIVMDNKGRFMLNGVKYG